MEKQNKHSCYGSIFYPESADFKLICDSLLSVGVKFAFSPEHNLDVNTSTGELKKPHRHLILHYDSPRSFNLVSDFLKSLHLVGCEVIQNEKGAFDYLTHKNAADKAQYSPDDIVTGNDYCVPTETVDLLEYFTDYIFSKNVDEFATLVIHARKLGKKELAFVFKHSAPLERLTRSIRGVKAQTAQTISEYYEKSFSTNITDPIDELMED